jgi:hypothetical protein
MTVYCILHAIRLLADQIPRTVKSHELNFGMRSIDASHAITRLVSADVLLLLGLLRCALAEARQLVFWGAACVLLVVLWVRSYWWIDIFEIRKPFPASALGSGFGLRLVRNDIFGVRSKHVQHACAVAFIAFLALYIADPRSGTPLKLAPRRFQRTRLTRPPVMEPVSKVGLVLPMRRPCSYPTRTNRAGVAGRNATVPQHS